MRYFINGKWYTSTGVASFPNRSEDEDNFYQSAKEEPTGINQVLDEIRQEQETEIRNTYQPL